MTALRAAGRSSGGEGGGVDDGEVGVVLELLQLALINIKAGSLGTTSSDIRRCRGWKREATGDKRSRLLNRNSNSFSSKHFLLVALEQL